MRILDLTMHDIVIQEWMTTIGANCKVQYNNRDMAGLPTGLYGDVPWHTGARRLFVRRGEKQRHLEDLLQEFLG